MRKEILDLLLTKPGFTFENNILKRNGIIFQPNDLDYEKTINRIKYPKFPFFSDTKYDILISTNNISTPTQEELVNEIYFSEKDKRIGIISYAPFFHIGAFGLLNQEEFGFFTNSARVVLCFDIIEANSLIYNDIIATTNKEDMYLLYNATAQERDSYLLNKKKELCEI